MSPGAGSGPGGGSLAFEARGLVAEYAGRRVLDVEHLRLSPGETLAVLGPNGAGKSTLLRLLALLERPRAGTLTVLGESTTTGGRPRLALRRRLVTVFQAPLLLNATVAENVALGLRFRGLDRRRAQPRVMHWLNRFGIAHLAERPARTLSGGEAQRVSLARAFVVEPELLLLDEPFASLDPHGREALALELEAVLRESRIATVLVTHDRAEALLLARDVVVLLDGRVAQQGPVDDVYARPADARVARFLGFENLLPVRLLGRADGQQGEIDLAGQRVRVPVPAGLSGDVLACLRAEDVHLAAPGHEGAGETGGEGVRLTAVVRHAVPGGVPYRVHLDAGFPLVALAARRTMRRLDVRPGTTLRASFDPAGLHLVAREAPPAPHSRAADRLPLAVSPGGG